MSPSRKTNGTILHLSTAPRLTPALPDPGPRRHRHDGPTVLVVDDQHTVLELVDAFLDGNDFRVYLAGSGRQALEICHRIDGALDLLLTDVRMPGMNGPELHSRMVERYPGVKVLFMSGFQAPVAASFGVPEGAPLVVKPFRPDKLLRRMRMVLGGVLELAGAGQTVQD